MGVYMGRLDVPPTHPRSYSAGSRTDKKLTGLTVPKEIHEYPAMACDQSIQFDTEALVPGENDRWIMEILTTKLQ
jgi:hypothetical protein